MFGKTLSATHDGRAALWRKRGRDRDGEEAKRWWRAWQPVGKKKKKKKERREKTARRAPGLTFSFSIT